MSKHRHSHDGETHWHVEVDLTREGHDMSALAELFVGNKVYEAHGKAHRDDFSPTVADRLAIARALSGLAHQLVNDASHEVDRAAHALDEYNVDVEAATKDVVTQT